MLNDLTNELREAADPEHATQTARFFKTGKGAYAEGDVFIGVSNQIRIGKNYGDVAAEKH